jgi:parvulin-like peptidyl-prolyl isomerase
LTSMAIRPLTLIAASGALAVSGLGWAAPKPTAPKTNAGTVTRLATKPAASTPSTTASPSIRAGSGIAAVVNGEPITEAEWLSRLRLMAGKNALDNLVREKVLRQEARKNGVTVTPADVDAKAKEFAKGYRDRIGPPAKFDEFLKSQGLSVASFESAMHYSAEMQLMQQRLSQKIGEKVQVTDQELQDTYEKQKFQFVQPAQFKIAHILLNFPGLDEAAQKKTKEDATALLEKVKAPGADFAALAKEYSQDTDTKEKGGELPLMSFSPFGPPFDQAVMAAPVGLIAEPVRSFKGYHIVKLIEKRPQRTRPFEEVKEELRKQLTERRQAQQYREYMQKAEHDARTEIKLKF